METLFIWYLVLILFTVLHIFEELGMRAEEVIAARLNVKNPRGVYLRVSTALVSISMAAAILLYIRNPAGPYLALFPVALAFVNFAVHNLGFAKTKKLYGTLASGVFSSYPAAISAGFAFYHLCQVIWG